MHLQGYRFFADDEDAFGLEDMLQAMMMLRAGSAYVPAKPWQHGIGNKLVSTVDALSKDAQSHLSQMQNVAFH